LLKDPGFFISPTEKKTTMAKKRIHYSIKKSGAIRNTTPVYSYAVTGTFHGSIVSAQNEGEARRIFHKHYKGESITHIRKRGDSPAWA